YAVHTTPPPTTVVGDTTATRKKHARQVVGGILRVVEDGWRVAGLQLSMLDSWSTVLLL
ncbi:hypothetical protein A2U01_0082987, partial [Trifolium medium]|nr:hypothetical protein [Trifolium medium]